MALSYGHLLLNRSNGTKRWPRDKAIYISMKFTWLHLNHFIGGASSVVKCAPYRVAIEDINQG